METILVFLAFFILAGITTYSAIQLSNASEKFEKYSKLSPIIIGAILAVATSLPEFATSITSSVILDTPLTSIANPIGSNMFNIVILAILNIMFYKKTINYYLKGNNNIFNAVVIFYYVLTFIVILAPNTPMSSIGHINILTFIIFILYFVAIKISGDSESNQVTHEDNPTELKKAIKTFVIFSIVVLVSSYFLSQTADKIMEITGLTGGFVGAVFLGIATSLPELISSFILCKHGSYNIAASNIIGSNIFNFSIVAINDLLYKQPMWSMIAGDQSVIMLFIFGAVMSAIMFFMIQCKTKKPYLNIIMPIAVIGLYVYYLMLSA